MTMNTQANRPLYIQLDSHDNVAIVANAGGLKSGTVFPDGLELMEDVPEGHKVAIMTIEAGQPVQRYGVSIGIARQRLPAGSWVHEKVMDIPAAPDLNDLPVATRKASVMTAENAVASGRTFMGYKNADGTVGTRNILGITTTVQCVASVVEHAVARIKRDLLPEYTNVDGVVALNHIYGCGVAINAPNSDIPIRTVRNIARNPNLGGATMVVSLGCEKMQPRRLFRDEDFAREDRARWVVRLQQEHGFGGMIDKIVEVARMRLKELNMREREPCDLSGLVVGLQCGGSDAFSGVTANPAIGHAADLLVDAGATVLFSEVSEVRDGADQLSARATDAGIARKFVEQMRWYDDYLATGGVDRAANTTPGNKQGGLSNIVEKSMGSIIKSGHRDISDVIPPGERVSKKGLNFAATPASDFVCGTLQLAAGMNVHVFSTGRGTPYGLAMAPVLKVSTRNGLKNQWQDLIDINAGRIADGSATIEEVGCELFELIIASASGQQSWTERWGLENDLALFNPAPVT